MFQNNANNAIRIASSGTANNLVNSSTYIFLDPGSDPTAGKNIGTIKFNLNIATQIEGALDRFVRTPTTSIFYTNVGIGKSPASPLVALDISGHLNATGNVYRQVAQPLNDNMPKAMNSRTRLTGNLNLSSETGTVF
jgi:hypothetical protein